MTTRAHATLHGVGGVRLFRQSWLPPSAARAAVVIVHGAGEHSDRYGHVAERLTAEGYAVHALDHRGHGRSQGRPGLIDHVGHAVSDVDQLVTIAGRDGSEPGRGLPVFMLGHSLGAMIALRYALAHQQRLTGLILSGALASVDASRILRVAGHLVAAVAPAAPLIGVDPELVSRDPAVVAAYRADPLVLHGKLPARTVAEIADTTAAFPGQVGEIRIPTLIVYGTADGLAPPSGSEMLDERIGSADKTVRAYPGLYHEVLNEPERETVLQDIVAWLDARAQAPGTGRAPTEGISPRSNRQPLKYSPAGETR